MIASAIKLQKLIEGTNQYLVPLFQRPYTWTAKEWDQLWTDITELMEAQSGEHFIGPIVTAPARSVPEGVAKYLLIDGQQRLTTLFIILTAMRDQAQALKLPTLGPEIDATLLKNQFKQGNDFFKLLPTQADRPSFIAVVTGEGAPPDNGITKCYKYFHKKLKALTAGELEHCKTVVVSRLIVVSVVLDESDNPHVIFESLNSKGRDLTQADLIRNYFLMRVHVDEQERVFQKLWVPIQERLGEGTTEFIRHFLMLKGTWVRKDTVYWGVKFEADRERTQAQVETYLANLERYSRYYHALVRPEEAEAVEELRSRLIRLRRIEVTTAHPLLMSLYHEYASGSLPLDSFVACLDMLENFMIRRWVCSVPTYDLNKFFPAVFAAAKASGDVTSGVAKALASKRYPRDAEFIERLCMARLYASGEKASKLKLLLERLENAHGHKEAVPFDELTIEHVLPQQMTESWARMLGNMAEEDHENWLHTLGNLTLTAYNPELGNADFSRKKRILGESHLELNRYFAPLDTWDRMAIETRAKRLAQEALEIWPNFAGDQTEPVRLPNAITGRKPLSVSIAGKTMPVDTWVGVLTATLRVLVELDEDLPEFLVATFPRYFKPQLESLRKGLQLSPNVFYEANLSAVSISKLCTDIIRERELTDVDWRVQVA